MISLSLFLSLSLSLSLSFLLFQAVLGMELVRKNTAHKESSREKSHVQEQGLMADSNHQAGQGKMVQHRLWPGMACVEGGA
jgi:hypothetical protein